jgi:hypothetical protein
MAPIGGEDPGWCCPVRCSAIERRGSIEAVRGRFRRRQLGSADCRRSQALQSGRKKGEKPEHDRLSALAQIVRVGEWRRSTITNIPVITRSNAMMTVHQEMHERAGKQQQAWKKPPRPLRAAAPEQGADEQCAKRYANTDDQHAFRFTLLQFPFHFQAPFRI